MGRQLTPKQEKVLAFIRQSISLRQMPPTIREIAGHFGFSSTGTVRDYLNALRQKGYVRLQAAKARAIELVDPGIAIIGKVMAGPGMVAEEDVQGYLPATEFLGIPDSRFAPALPFNPWPGRRDLFALHVKGDSMTGKGILDGDMVIVRKAASARDRQIVVALLGEEATVKEFRLRGGRPVLLPANKNYQPIVCDENTRILGIVERVIRSYV